MRRPRRPRLRLLNPSWQRPPGWRLTLDTHPAGYPDDWPVRDDAGRPQPAGWAPPLDLCEEPDPEPDPVSDSETPCSIKRNTKGEATHER